jgi:hypothetical protein
MYFIFYLFILIKIFSQKKKKNKINHNTTQLKLIDKKINFFLLKHFIILFFNSFLYFFKKY